MTATGVTVTVDGLHGEQTADGVRELDLAAHAGRLRGEKSKDFRVEQVTTGNRKAGGSRFGRGFFNEVVEAEDACGVDVREVRRLGCRTPGSDAVAGDLLKGHFFEADDVHFVDLPGYGFARRSKAERDRWAELIGDFFDSERSFNLVVSLVDIRHDPSKLDHDMIDYLQGNEFNFIVCLTKADKLSRTQQARQAAAIKKQLNVPAENVIITSSQTGAGIDELKKRIAEACL